MEKDWLSASFKAAQTLSKHPGLRFAYVLNQRIIKQTFQKRNDVDVVLAKENQYFRTIVHTRNDIANIGRTVCPNITG
jgi:hypothetical protein